MVWCDVGLQVKMKFPRLLDGFGDGLAGEQIVAEKDRPERLHRRAVTDKPTFRRVALTVLFLRAMLRGDEFRRKRPDLLVAGCHDARA